MMKEFESLRARQIMPQNQSIKENDRKPHDKALICARPMPGYSQLKKRTSASLQANSGLKHHADLARWSVFARTIDFSSTNESIT